MCLGHIDIKYCTSSNIKEMCKAVYDKDHIAEVGHGCPLRHREYRWPALNESKHVIMSDSICKYVNELPNSDVLAFSRSNYPNNF